MLELIDIETEKDIEKTITYSNDTDEISIKFLTDIDQITFINQSYYDNSTLCDVSQRLFISNDQVLKQYPVRYFDRVLK